MARGIKLPEELKDWKIISLVSEKKGQNKYRIVKKDSNGEVFANLFHIFAYGDHYSSEKADFFEDEVNFLNSIADKKEYFTCFGAYLYDNPSKEKADMYIATEELEPFSKVMRSKTFTDDEITDFGLQMAEILAFLEENNIFHGNIRPENIFVTDDGKYKLGGFSDFECKATDLDFSAPEVAEGRNPDLTTDIYSVGLIMYCLANNKALPFEGGLTTKAEAVKMRTEGAAITAPANGNEKLKSIIIIAIQPKNENRWKNALNMKNALLASCGKLTVEPPKEEEQAESNAVEKAEESGKENTEPTIFEQTVALPQAEKDEADSHTNEVYQPTEVLADNKENTADATTENVTDNTPVVSADTAQTPISNDVFEDYEATTKIIDSDVTTPKKDYGSFFDDQDTVESESYNKTAPIADNDKSANEKAAVQTEQKQFSNVDIFSSDSEANAPKPIAKDNDAEPKKKKKGATIALVTVSVVIILAVLGFVGYIVYQEIFANRANNKKPATADEVTTAEVTTVAPTTVKPTTQPTTTAEKEVINVVGYDYESAKEKLEALGFKVAEGNHLYSTLYSDGYVISQSPESGTMASTDTVITLDISLGQEYTEPETSDAEESSNSSATDNSFIFANSDSSYISKSDVKDLSDSELELALNEIYAKRGWIFTDSELAAYFNSQSWYTPRYTSSEFSKNVTFNEYEQANIQLIINEEKSRGIR